MRLYFVAPLFSQAECLFLAQQEESEGCGVQSLSFCIPSNLPFCEDEFPDPDELSPPQDYLFKRGSILPSFKHILGGEE